MSYLLGFEAKDLETSVSPIAPVGPVLESFVLCELRKQVGWSAADPTIHHYQSARHEEVDIVLEDRRGRVVGIEVKASATVEARDFWQLKQLQEDLGKRFVAGYVLHTGRDAIAFGRGLSALPIAALWRS
jgi:predicted AAA+ superfamily ATPase